MTRRSSIEENHEWPEERKKSKCNPKDQVIWPGFEVKSGEVYGCRGFSGGSLLSRW